MTNSNSSLESNGISNPIELFFNQAERNPEGLALASPRTTLTFKMLERFSRQMARKLTRLGIRPGETVGVNCQPETMVIVWLALLQIGATTLHVNASISIQFGESIGAVIVDDSLTKIKHNRLMTIDSDFLESLDGTRPLDETTRLTNTSLIRVVFSSGTTGVPKGVPFTVENFLSRLESARVNWIPMQPFMSLLGPDTVSGFQTVFAQLFSGNTYLVSHDGEKVWDLIKINEVKSIKTSPAKLADLIRAHRIKGSIADLGLEVIQVAGSLLSKSLAAHCLEAFGVTPTYLYGSTEVGTVSRGDFNPEKPNCVGQLVPEVECEIVDTSDTPVPAGQIGFVRVRQREMPVRYWQGPKTETSGFRFGWFYPGDSGSIDSNSELFIDGRSDDFVNAGGVKANLALLDQALSDVKEFSDVATFEFEGQLGESQIGVAYTSFEAIKPDELQRLVSNSTPGYKFSSFVRLDSIPRNALGKVQRQELSNLNRV
jgi:acyl-coenzyme A synthetase/AMP-(fatty) acid ligase